MADIDFPSGFSNATLPLNPAHYFLLNDRRATLAQVASYVSGATSNTFIWRPTEPAPAGNVFATWAALAARAATVYGEVVVFADPTLSTTFEITPGTYPLACTALQLVIPQGIVVEITDDGSANAEISSTTLASITISGGVLESQAQHAPFYSGAFGLALRNSAQLRTGTGASVVTFDFATTTGILLDTACQIQTGTYESLQVSAPNALYLLPGLSVVIGPDVIRGTGGAALLHNSDDDVISGGQSNLSGGLTLQDTSLSGYAASRISQMLSATITSSASVSVNALDAHIINTYGAGAANFTLPPAVTGCLFKFVKGNGAAFGMTLTPDGSDLINGFNTPLLLAGSDNATFAAGEWCAVCPAPGQWSVWGWGTPLSALASRVTALEAPTPGNESGTSVSWTTQAELWLQNTSMTTVTTDASTGQWAVNVSRLCSVDNNGSTGMTLNVPSGHTLNGVLNGSSGVIGNSALVATSGMFSILVTRRSSTAWVWR